MDNPTKVDSWGAGPTRSAGLSFVGFLVGAVLVAVALGQLTSPDPAPRTPAPVAVTSSPGPPAIPAPDMPIGVESIKRCPAHLGGLVLGNYPRVRGSALERWDCDALNGPWSVVIRAADGHFGLRSAVVTFPVDLDGSGVPSTRPKGGIWNPAAARLVWPLGTTYAQIVGDLGQSTLENLAMRITVEGGKPRFQALDGFAVAAAIPYGLPVVHEMRYGAEDLEQESKLGDGLVFTGVTRGASFESRAFESRAKPAGLVRGKSAIYSSALGGSGTLAWEPAPGLVHYIGYSSTAPAATAVDDLRVLADEGRLLTPAQWNTKDRYPVAPQSG